MSAYILVLTGFGVLVLLTAWLPMLLKELPLSLPIVCVGLGALIFALPGAGFAPHPQDNLAFAERLTELVVIIALMGAGLRLDRPLAWATSRLTWRLLVLAMPLTIAALALLGYSLLGLSAAAAMLLAASLAPTDPALGIRAAERNHSYDEKLHDFIEQLERLLMMLLLVLRWSDRRR